VLRHVAALLLPQQPGLSVTTGEDLRAARLEAGLTLTSVAATCGVSPGHLSRVERGERVNGSVSPSIVRGYEVALGQQIAATSERRPSTTLADVRRRSMLGLIAAASVGSASEPLSHLLDGLTRPSPPSRVGDLEIGAIDEAADLYTRLDLQHGGGLAAEVAHGSLHWAVGLLHQKMTDEVRARLCSAVAALADRVAWSTYDAGDHAVATRLWTLALDTAARGADRDLRGHILLNFSTLLFDTGQGADAVETLRLALGDERVSATERANLHAVCARHAAGIGHRDSALRHISLAEDALGQADLVSGPSWARRVTAEPGHFDAAIGMAWHVLDERTAAHDRLTVALARLGPGRARTALRCRTRLAVLHLLDGDADGATDHAIQAVSQAATVRSARIGDDLRILRDTAQQRAMTDLSAELGRALWRDSPRP
jgi:transcriptional regulator with XRE-family HTH domain